MDLGIAGRVALVTASSKGLGRASAEALSAEGARVVVTARGEAALRETEAAIRRRGGDPYDFGQVVAFLCSQQANFVSGVAVNVDGAAVLGLL